jgi:hypothetical protein
MPDGDKVENLLTIVFWLTYPGQFVALVVAIVGLVALASPDRPEWGLHLLIGGWIVALACILLRSYTKARWRRRYPIE